MLDGLGELRLRYQPDGDLGLEITLDAGLKLLHAVGCVPFGLTGNVDLAFGVAVDAECFETAGDITLLLLLDDRDTIWPWLLEKLVCWRLDVDWNVELDLWRDLRRVSKCRLRTL